MVAAWWVAVAVVFIYAASTAPDPTTCRLWQAAAVCAAFAAGFTYVSGPAW